MSKKDDSLFKIGEITKILGITRKTLLVYEDMGLLTPSFKDEKSGYRYYTADNMTQIRSIRSLQALGLSLSEIKEYYYDTKNIDHHLQHLMELRAALDRNIHLLQVRAVKSGDFSVHHIRLPQQVCYCRRYQCENIADASIKLRDTYIAAARTGCMSMAARMFTMRMGESIEKLDLMCCIPVQMILWVKNESNLQILLLYVSITGDHMKNSEPPFFPCTSMYRRTIFRLPDHSAAFI